MKLHLRFSLNCVLLLLGAFPSLVSASAPLKLNPQMVVDAVMNQGLDAKVIQLQAEQASYGLSLARGAYDWNLNSSASYELTRLQTLMGLSNLEDRNTQWRLGLSKKIPTGTTLSLTYNRQFQNSITNSFLASAHPPDQVLDYFDLGFRQELLNNAFGINDRRKVLIAEREIQRAALLRQDALQDVVLNSIRLFWKAYVSGYSLKEAVLARDKYKTLVDVIRAKLSKGLAEPSDLGKVQTQYSAQDRRVKAASLQHLDDMDNLFMAMHTPAVKEVEFDVSLDLPAPPQEFSPKVEALRAVQASQLGVDNAQTELKKAQLSTWPEVALFGNVSTNGVNTGAQQSFSDMSSATHPRYLIGIELKHSLWSDIKEGEARFRQVQADTAATLHERVKESELNALAQSERNVRSFYLIAQAAQETATQWDSIIKDRERQFRGARVGTSEIIQDYSLYFQARADAVSALADYHYTLYRYKAMNDQLVR